MIVYVYDLEYSNCIICLHYSNKNKTIYIYYVEYSNCVRSFWIYILSMFFEFWHILSIPPKMHSICRSLIVLVSGEVGLRSGRGAIEGLVRRTQHRPPQGRRRNNNKTSFLSQKSGRIQTFNIQSVS